VIKTTAINLPLEVLISRFENHEKEMARELAACRWWQWKRRWVLSGARAAYQMEVEAAYAIGGTQQEIWLELAGRMGR
jgi:hypothetical protein